MTNKTDRLNHIREIATRLSAEECCMISLAFEHAGMKPSRVTSRSKPLDYAVKNLAKATDEVIHRLAIHLGVGNEGTGSGSLWKEGQVRMFLSHLAREKESAAQLRDVLSRFGVSAFVAHSDIVPSREWLGEIESALRTCHVLVALMVKGFHESFWTDHEVGYALGRGIPVIPVSMGENPYGFLARIQAVKFRGIDELGDTLFRLLIEEPATSKLVSHALVYQFTRSMTFAAATANFRLLKKIRCWDDEMIGQVRHAVKVNDQIRGAFDIPEGVRLLLRKASDARKLKTTPV